MSDYWIKIPILSKQESARAQQIIFNHGGGWSVGGPTVRPDWAIQGLYLTRRKNLIYAVSTYSFEQVNAPIVKIEELDSFLTENP